MKTTAGELIEAAGEGPVTMITTDAQAYAHYRQHRNWYDKLWLSQRLGLLCGPHGQPVPRDGAYIVRPIINLLGMGIGARRVEADKGDSIAGPGEFWAEWLDGEHITADYKWSDGGWRQGRTLKGCKIDSSGFRFDHFNEIYRPLHLPDFFDELSGVPTINVEAIGPIGSRRIIEVHLRPNPDPAGQTLMPVFKGENLNTSEGWQWVDDFEDCDGFLNPPRLGFYVRG